MLMAWRRVSRGASAVLVVGGIVYVVAALASAAVGRAGYHMPLALYGGALLFPYGVAIAYVASAASTERARRLVAASGLVGLAALASPALAAAGHRIPADILVALGFLVLAAASLEASRTRRESARLSLEMFTATHALAAAALVAADSWGVGIVNLGLGLAAAYPVTLIYSVTVHSLPSTFKDEPDEALAWLLPALDFAASLEFLNGRIGAGALLVVASMLVYVPAARLHRLARYAQALSGRDPSSPAVRGLRYFLQGHWAVLASITIVAAVTAYYFVGYCTALCLLHSYLLGFSTIHVAIHAPMMLPVILKLRHKRRYNPAPFLLILASMALWPISGEAALALYAAGLAAVVLVAWP